MSFAELDRNQLAESLVSVGACRALWCAVMTEQFRLAIAPLAMDRRVEVDQARGWFESKDFRTVCSLIGLNDIWVLEHVQPQIARALAVESAGGDLRDVRPRSQRGRA